MKADIKVLSPPVKSVLISVVAIFLLFISLSCVLLVNYGEYDEGTIIPSPDANYVYQQTDNFLNSISAKTVYSVNPIFTALDPKLKFTSDFDTYSLLWMVRESPDQFIQDQIDQGVDYVVIDNIWLANIGPDNSPAQELVQAVQNQGRLVGIVAPGLPTFATIWALNVDKDNIFNGNFAQWAQDENIKVPLGWLPIFSSGSGDNVGIAQANLDGKQCLELYAAANGSSNSSTTVPEVSLNQSITFPEGNITFNVCPTGNTSMAQSTGIHFTSSDGHTLILGFSDAVNPEQIIKSADGNTVLVLRNAALNQWSAQTIDLTHYWNEEGWALPQTINMQLVAAGDNSKTGEYNYYIADIGQ